MDERNGIPAALAPWRPPVVSGIAWLGDDGDASWVKDATVTRALMRTAGLFTECRAMLEPLSSIRGVDPRRLHFVTLGIDENHFSPSSEPPIPDRVFSVGDDRMRDYGTLVAALRQVRRGRPGLTAEVATKLAIDIPEEWSIVHRRRMDHAVRARYHDAAVVALALQPTRSGSGLTVILEAMASARPVVVTDNPGLDDYVEHGVTGLLVPPHSPRAMAEAISSLLADPRKATAMGLAARERVERRFTTKHMAGDLDRVLRAAVPVPRHARR
ncbi:MAG: glycosyltransferase family 4 protein [Mobilicoccus sp.]|nr:glycosyltransferase family 4 protein [Mobilicoccus sp.]